jgi:hypothetical protein
VRPVGVLVVDGFVAGLAFQLREVVIVEGSECRRIGEADQPVVVDDPYWLRDAIEDRLEEGRRLGGPLVTAGR